MYSATARRNDACSMKIIYGAVLRLAGRVSVAAQIACNHALALAQPFDLRNPVRVIAREAVNERQRR
jgi:hypothetical protein